MLPLSRLLERDKLLHTNETRTGDNVRENKCNSGLERVLCTYTNPVKLPMVWGTLLLSRFWERLSSLVVCFAPRNVPEDNGNMSYEQSRADCTYVSAVRPLMVLGILLLSLLLERIKCLHGS
jgi:hypothetical protein